MRLMTDDVEPQSSKKVITNSEYLPYSKTATFTDSENNVEVVKNITNEQFDQINADIIAKSTLSTSNNDTRYRAGLASGVDDDKTSLMGAGRSDLMESGIPPSKEKKENNESK